MKMGTFLLKLKYEIRGNKCKVKNITNTLQRYYIYIKYDVVLHKTVENFSNLYYNVIMYIKKGVYLL